MASDSLTLCVASYNDSQSASDDWLALKDVPC